MASDRPPREPAPDVSNMFSVKVDNIDFNTRKEDLTEVFEKYGAIGDIFIPRDSRTRRSRGFAFVRYLDEKDAEAAISAENGKELLGRTLRLEMAKYSKGDRPHEPRRDRDSYRDRGGYDRDRRDTRDYYDRDRRDYARNDRDRERDRYGGGGGDEFRRRDDDYRRRDEGYRPREDEYRRRSRSRDAVPRGDSPSRDRYRDNAVDDRTRGYGDRERDAYRA